MKKAFREPTDQAVRVTRRLLLGDVRLPQSSHAYIAADGSRWSNEYAKNQRNAFLREAKRRTRVN